MIGVVIIPLAFALVLAGIQLVDAGKGVVQAIQFPQTAEAADKLLGLEKYPRAADLIESVKLRHRICEAAAV